MKKIYIFLFVCVAVLSAVAQTTPNLYRAVDKEKMNHWVDSVFDAMSYDERIGQLFMVIANPKSDTRNMQRLMRYVNEIKIGGILFHKGDPVTQAEVTNRLQKASRVPMLVSLDGERQFVNSGLKAGERVVSDGVHKVIENVIVDIVK